MKKSLACIALAFVGTTAFAQSFDYSATPESGVVTELSTVDVVFTGWNEIEVNSKDDLTVTLNGEAIEGVDVKNPYGSNEIIFTMPDRMLTPGTYAVNIPAWSITGYNADYTVISDLEEDIVIEYVIEGGAADLDFSYEADPAAGVVTELETVTLTFPAFNEIEIVTKDDLAVTYNGTPVEGVDVKNTYYGSNAIMFTLPEVMKSAGEYVIAVAPGSICGYDAEYNPYDLTEEITLAYTIQRAAGELDFTFTADPVSGSVVNGLSKVELVFPGLLRAEADKSGVSVSVDGVALDASGFDVVGSDVPEYGNHVYVTFDPAIEEGNVAVSFAAGSVAGSSADGEGTNPEAFELRYTAAASVEYDLTLSLSSPTKPNADGEISAEKQLDGFFFAADMAGLVANPDSELINVTISQVNGDYRRSAHLANAYGLDQAKTYFSADFGLAPTYNGEYVITVDKGAFGNAVWSENPELGHSNDALEFRFTLVDGVDASVNDIDPLSVVPAEGNVSAPDLRTVTVTFPEGVEMKGQAYASLAGVDVSFQETAEFVANGDGSFTAEFGNIPVELGEYVVSIVAGQFGDADYVAGNGGHGNAGIEVSYIVDSLTAVGNIGIDAEDKVIYTITGIRVDADVESLPAGVYIISGKKVIVK